MIVVSTSGIVTPSLDALLLNRMGFRPDLERLPVFGLGCAGGALGLARAAALARATPGKNYLLLVVELCSLTFRNQDCSKGNIVASALFGDGAAALILRAEPADSRSKIAAPAILGWGEHTWPNSQDVMGWHIEEDGFGVLFSKEIPTLVRERFRPACEAFLDRCGLRLSQLQGHICHPGGAKVLKSLAAALDLDSACLGLSQRILRDYGNMSAVSVLFVLKEAMRDAKPGKHLLSALGPGFSVGFVLLELPGRSDHAGIS
jgi:alkylresorcinol/alkylpyrone synthase